MSVRPQLSRPLRNRVDPFGATVANPARGLLMGNRGCLHDDAGVILRGSARPAWISCVLSWSDRNRPLMRPGYYTELFFLDEATAIAAGHRPCGECRSKALTAFKQAWARAHRLSYQPRVGEIDAILRSSKRGSAGDLEALPDGAIIAVAGQPLLRRRGGWLPWTFDGYGDPVAPDASWVPTLITPTPMIEVLRAGYRPLVHASAGSISDDRTWRSWSHAAGAAGEAAR